MPSLSNAEITQFKNTDSWLLKMETLPLDMSDNSDAFARSVILVMKLQEPKWSILKKNLIPHTEPLKSAIISTINERLELLLSRSHQVLHNTWITSLHRRSTCLLFSTGRFNFTRMNVIQAFWSPTLFLAVRLVCNIPRCRGSRHSRHLQTATIEYMRSTIEGGTCQQLYCFSGFDFLWSALKHTHTSMRWQTQVWYGICLWSQVLNLEFSMSLTSLLRLAIGLKYSTFILHRTPSNQNCTRAHSARVSVWPIPLVIPWSTLALSTGTRCTSAPRYLL